MALDENFETVVDSLDDINWVREYDGLIYSRQLGKPKILSHWRGWATVLLCMQDRDKGWSPPRFVLTRWQRLMGAWRIKNHMRMSWVDVEGLVHLWTPEYQEELKKHASMP